MAGRQPMQPPFGVGIQHKIFNAEYPANTVVATYVGPTPNFPAGWHTFQVVGAGNLINIDTATPLYGTQGLFVGYKGNAGGRRKSRRSKRSHRKTKRRHH